jgi:hypothetical protein
MFQNVQVSVPEQCCGSVLVADGVVFEICPSDLAEGLGNSRGLVGNSIRIHPI